MTAQPQSAKPPHARPDTVRMERDRYVAFAFAAADLLIEVDRRGIVLAVIGATQKLTGRTAQEAVGLAVDGFAVPTHRCLIRQLVTQVQSTGRIDPMPIELRRPDGSTVPILIGGCTLPTLPGEIFLSVSTLPLGVSVISRPRDEATGLLTMAALQEAAERDAQANPDKPTQLKLLQIDGLTHAVGQIPAAQASQMMEEIGAALRAQSVGGDQAGRLADDSFGYIANVSSDGLKYEAALLQTIDEVVRSAGVKDGMVSTQIARVDLAAGGLSEAEIGRAVAYAMKKFIEVGGDGFDIQSLASGLAAAVSETVGRVSETRRMIEAGNFTLAYQSVVNIQTGIIHHYEALARFAGAKTTFETITFSEDVGLIATLDMSICERAIKALQGNTNASVAVNLSGRSIQTDAFRQALGELIRPLNGLRSRLLFELTESAAVEDLEAAAAFLRWIRKLGHEVCLDDFGAGAAAYSYLRRFDVDFVKIDGPFLNSASSNSRDRSLLQSIGTLCANLGCRVIGEMIEDQKTAELSTALGIEFGQGWLFGKPISELPAPVIAGKRKGSRESWG